MKKQVQIQRQSKAKVTKLREIDELATEIKKYPAVLLVEMRGMPSKILSKLRKKLMGKATFKMNKKTVIRHALLNAGLKELAEKIIDQQVALILTKEDPFLVYKQIVLSKVNVPASEGKTHTADIIIPAGDTGLPPGPALADLQKANIPAKIAKGKVVVDKDTMLVKAGQKITKEAANALIKLGVEPFTVQLNVLHAWHSGKLYNASGMYVDEKELLALLGVAHNNAFNLSVESGWVVRENISLFLSRAAANMRALAREAAIISKENVGEILAKAQAGASALAGKIGGA